MNTLILLLALADLQPGNWEITATTEVQGIREPSSMAQTRCLTEEEARDPSRIFGASPGRGAGRVRYSATTLDGELELKTDQLSAASRISGRRLGACP